MSAPARRRPGRPPKPIDPELSPMHRLVFQLRELRLAAGLTHRSLEEQIKERCSEQDRCSRGIIQRLESCQTDPIPPKHFKAYIVGCGADEETWQAIYEDYQRDLAAWRSADKKEAITHGEIGLGVPKHLGSRAVRTLRQLGSQLMLTLALTVSVLMNNQPHSAHEPQPLPLSHAPSIRSYADLRVDFRQNGFVDLDQVPPAIGANLSGADLSIEFKGTSIYFFAIPGSDLARVAPWKDGMHSPSYTDCHHLAQKGTRSLQLAVGQDACVLTNDGRTAWLHVEVTRQVTGQMTRWWDDDMGTVTPRGFATTVWDE